MNRKERAAFKRQQNERFQLVLAATADERARFNAALAAGKTATLQTAFGPHDVVSVNDDFWFTTFPQGARRDQWSRRSFAGCNDGRWADLLQQVGEPRNDLFKEVV